MAGRGGDQNGAPRRLQKPDARTTDSKKKGFESVIPMKDKLDENRNLLIATFSGRIADVRKALEKGADPDARDRYGRTPLMLAAMENFVEIGELLLEREADPRAVDKHQMTALAHAETYYNKGMMRLLENALAA